MYPGLASAKCNGKNRHVKRGVPIWDNERMPIYVYRASGESNCSLCEKPFERRQKVEHSRLTACPECRSPVRQVITAPNLAKPVPNLSETNVEKHGFTQYKKAGKGVYEKTAGKGPEILTDNDD